MYKMIIVDDESYVSEQLSLLIDWQSIGFNPVNIFSNYTDALKFIRTNRIDVLLTDIRLGEKLGLDLIREARQYNPEMEAVLISAFSEFEYAHEAISLKVFEYLLKPISLDCLKKCFTRLQRKMSMHISGYHFIENDVDTHIDRPSNSHYLNIIKSYVSEHYSDDLSLEDIASKLPIDAKYLSYYFKQQTNQNFSQYLRQIRIQKAIELLKDSSIKLSTIHNRIGYRSKSQFYKVFVREIGYTPAKYRDIIFRLKFENIHHEFPLGACYI